ncbi:LOG family protein [Patescibacteria group bacterium]|nr:LOG family protein [Patescibacteria group bacterium]
MVNDVSEVGKFERIKAVSFLGYADAQEGDELFESAKETARMMAEHGVINVNGGGPGVMRAATEGAHEGGGKAYVATFYPKHIETFEGKDPLNKADKEIVMNTYLDRTLKLLELGNAYVIFNGGTGTVSEFGMAWGLAKLYIGHHKPLILYGEFWHEILESFAANMHIRPEALRVYRIVSTPEDALKALWHYEQELKKGMYKPELKKNGVDIETAFRN